MKKYILILAMMTIFLQAKSQDYIGSVGFRGGPTWGINFKAFMDESHAIEGILSFRERGLQFNVLLEKYKPLRLETTDNFYIFYGYGAHVGFIRQYQDVDGGSSTSGPTKYSYQTTPVLGGDLMIGLEYRLYSAPFAFTFDYKPYFEMFGDPFFRVNFGDFALTARYTFK